MVLLQQGKKYQCIKKTTYGFNVGHEYLAITSHQLLNNDASPVEVSGWDIDLFSQYFTLTEENVKKENVNHPNHYNQGGIECLDVIKAYYGNDGYEGFCAGNVLKYVMRYKHKENALEDLKKARFYLDEVIKMYDDTKK